MTLTCLSHASDIVFHVRDDGPGMPDDRMVEIFVPFFTTKPGGRGTGVTLARRAPCAA